MSDQAGDSAPGGHELLRATAPAKVNLFLHITGRRADGYHLLDSLFVFTRTGDTLIFREADRGGHALDFKVSGPFAGTLRQGNTPEDNLVIKAARALADEAGIKPHISIELVKNLPVAAGIGGGSADAAAVLRALNALWQLDLPLASLEAIGLNLGADVPACLLGQPVHVSGIGETLAAVSYQGPRHILLVNPGVALSTPAVFKAFARAGQAYTRPAIGKGSADDPLVVKRTQIAMTEALLVADNDLEAPAISLCPEISNLLGVLRAQDGAILARMSGSGATCFALFERREDCLKAHDAIKAAHPDWWMMADEISAG